MAIMLRLKCPSCGEVMNAAGFCNCTKCGTPIRYNGWGMLQMAVGLAVPLAAEAAADDGKVDAGSLGLFPEISP